MYLVQCLCMPINGLVPEIRCLEMLVVKNKLITNKGILQCSHLAVLSKLELNALRSAMYGITQEHDTSANCSFIRTLHLHIWNFSLTK